jgi:NADP-dependent 3-hydroxy acid dehydrogenase YdfG
MKTLNGKTAVITGASAGIGKAIALHLRELGAAVVAVARRPDRLKELEAHGIEGLVCDITKDLGPLRDLEQKRKIDILINNAGLARGRGPVDETSMEDIDEMLNTNLRALLEVTKIFLPGFRERDAGDIVNLGSIAGLFTYAGGSVYCATKYAVHALSEAWRQDLLGTKIRVIEICPGMVETEFSEVRFKGDVELAKKVYQGMQPLTAEDIAETVGFALTRPAHVTMQSMLIMPTDQASVGLVHRRS